MRQPHVLVIGSTGLLGLAIAAELRSKRIRFAEIRSHFQFDVSEPSIYQMLEQIPIRAIVNLAHNQTWTQPNFTLKHLHKFCEKHEITIFQPVREFVGLPHTIQIRVPPVWGPTLLLPNLSVPGVHVWECLRLGSTTIQGDGKYVFSGDVAAFIVDRITDFLKGVSVPAKIEAPDFPVSSLPEIGDLLEQHGCRVTGTSAIASGYSAGQFEIAWDFARRQLTEQRRPYASHVIVASNVPRIIDLFSRVLTYFDAILGLYPAAPLELVCVFCPSEDAFGKFFEVFSVPGSLRRYIRVIEVPPAYVQARRAAHNISYFPEFDMKNIGIRRARGEYVLSANSDIIPPVGFFETVTKRALSPLSYIRSKRILANYSKHADMIVYWFSMQLPKWEFQSFIDVCADRRYYDKYERDGCGDFQGDHREMWAAVHGFLESQHVFHVDTGISLEFSAFPSMIYARVLGANVHLRHAKESKQTSHFKFYDDAVKNGIRQGIMTRMTMEYARPHWGADGINFTSY
jgi:hypothetical protein